ncbi:MAG: hypothetical protein QOE22_469 [Candidatus Parcubacteria bacterium]|jgi:hypothetical protein|nr:hypothetical protein [Candidatus Parcubacteria bacterium]
MCKKILVSPAIHQQLRAGPGATATTTVRAAHFPGTFEVSCGGTSKVLSCRIIARQGKSTGKGKVPVMITRR